MADNKKAVCGGFLVGDGLEFEGKTLYATSTGGTEDYTELENKPSINNVELNGNKTLEDLGIASKDDLDEAVTTLEDAIDNIVDDIESVDTTLQQHADKIAANSSRIDTFTHLPEGSTTGDAELADIRVGYNGETYSSAGSAVREQVSGLKQDLSQVSESIIELGNAVATKNGGETIYIDTEKIFAEQGYRFTLNADLNKIASEKGTASNKSVVKAIAEGGKTYKITYTKNVDLRYACGYAFVDENNNVLLKNVAAESGSVTVIEEVEAPQNTAYIFANRASLTFPEVLLKSTSEGSWESKSYTKEETYTKTETEFKIQEAIPKHKTCILFNFDAPPNFVSDGRKALLDKYRIPYTVNITVKDATTATYPDSSKGRNYIDEILRDGNDFAIYSSSSTKPVEDASVYNGDDDAIELFESYVREAKECAERFGIFNPTAWFCRFMRTGTAMNQALINLGFKICRGYKYGVTPAESTNSYIKDWNNHDKQMFNVNAQSIQSDGVDGTKARIDTAIENGWDLAPFAHGIYETQEEATAGNGITKEVFEAVLAYARQKEDEGLCELMTFRDYYRLKYPADGGMNDISRERKYSDWKYGQMIDSKVSALESLATEIDEVIG